MLHNFIYLFILFFSLFELSFAKDGLEANENSDTQQQKQVGLYDWSPLSIYLDEVVLIKTYQGEHGDFQHNSVDYQRLTKYENIPRLIARQIRILKKISSKTLRL